MKTLQFYTVFFTIFLIDNSYSQVCGGGIASLNIYTLNGTTLKDANYEIFAVSEEFTRKYPDKSNKPHNRGLIIIDSTRNEFGYLQNDLNKELQHSKSLDSTLVEYLKFSSIPKSGKFTSTLQLKTQELIYFPVVVKIIFEKKSTFIFGNFFGGCNRNIFLLWNGYYFNLF